VAGLPGLVRPRQLGPHFLPKLLNAPVGQQPFQSGAGAIVTAAASVEDAEDGFEHRKQILSWNEWIQQERGLGRRSQSATDHDPKTRPPTLLDGANPHVRNQRADVVVTAAFKRDFDFARKLLQGRVLAQIAVRRQRVGRDVKNLVGRDTRQRTAHHASHHRTAGSQGRQPRCLEALQKWDDFRRRHAGDFDSLPGGQMRARRPLGFFRQAGNCFQLSGRQKACRDADTDDITARLPAQAVDAVPHANALGIVSRARLRFQAECVFQGGQVVGVHLSLMI